MPLGWPLESPFVGRSKELELLEEALELAIAERRCRLVTVAGGAGFGKSRLVREVAARAPDVSILSARAIGEPGLAFAPLADLARQAAGADPGAHARDVRRSLAGVLSRERTTADAVAAAAGVSGSPPTLEETFSAGRELVTALARRRPALLAIEEAQRGGPALRGFLEYLERTVVDVAVLLVSLVRTDDGRSAGDMPAPEAKATGTRLSIGPLAAPYVRQLVDISIAGEGDAQRKLATRVAQSSGGNPLFVEQALALLADTGALRIEGDAWVPARDPASISLPSTLHGLVQARLELLDAREREVLKAASLLDEVTIDGAVALTELPESEVRQALDLLDAAGLLLEEGPPGRSVHRFVHEVVREAAYAGLSDERRAELHERMAAWVERRPALGELEGDVLVGVHLERAFHHRERLSGSARAAADLAGRAATRLRRAGGAAFSRGDIPAAVELLERAVALVPDETSTPPELLLELGVALLELGDVPRADAVLTDAVGAARAENNLRVELNALLERSDLRASAGRTEGAAELLRVAEQAIPMLWQLEDELGLARAWRNVADAHCLACRYGVALESLERALIHSRGAGDRKVELQVLSDLALVLLHGPTPVDTGIERLRAILDGETGTPSGPVADAAGPAGRAMIEALGLARLEAMRGRFSEARALCASARETFEELGEDLWLATVALVAARVETLAGALEAAERELRASYESLSALGDRSVRSTAAAELGEVALALGNADEAAELTRESERLAGETDVVSQVAWRSVRAKVLARQARWRQAEALARAAVRVAAETDFLNLRGDALMSFSSVLRGEGRQREARAAVGRALKLYEDKGNLVSARRARGALDSLSARSAG